MQWDAIWIRWIKKRYDKSARFELQTAIFLNCSSFHALFPYGTFTGQFDSHFKPKTIYLSVVQKHLIYKKKPGKIFEMVLRLHFCPNSHHTCTEASSILIQRSAFEHWKWSNRFMNKNKKLTLKRYSRESSEKTPPSLQVFRPFFWHSKGARPHARSWLQGVSLLFFLHLLGSTLESKSFKSLNLLWK